TKPYSSKLSLVQIGQVGVGIGTSPLGTYVGGGVSLLFSDMLGDQLVGATIQASGSVKDIGGYVGYENRKHRWTWGGSIQQVPLLSASFASGPDTVNGQQVFVEQ